MKKPTTKKQKRPNPHSARVAAALETLSGDMLVLARLIDWTKDEKLILAAMLPDIRKMLRQVPAAKLAEMTAPPHVTVKVTGKAKIVK